MEKFALLHQYGDLALFGLRAVVAMIFLVHGIWKIENGRQVAQSVGMPNSGWFFISLGVAEFLGSLALLSGFLTPFAALGLMIIMLGALYFKLIAWRVPFTAHNKTGWELDILIFAACGAILVMGAGKIALDRAIFGIF